MLLFFVGWTGDKCNEDLDECKEANLCKNSGKCINLEGKFLCQCKPLYVGMYCEEIKNLCDPSPCLNGGTCITSLSSMKCECPEDYKGSKCENYLESSVSFFLFCFNFTLLPYVKHIYSFCI